MEVRKEFLNVFSRQLVLPFLSSLRYNKIDVKIRKEPGIGMKDYMGIYQEWLSNPYFDEATKEELRAIAGEEKEIKERFYMDLEFGTQDFVG